MIRGHEGDTIAAVATAPGVGAVGIVRVSGPGASAIAQGVLSHLPASRRATVSPFRDATGGVIDQGIALFFQAPASFTGEDVLELHGHGGPAVLDLILARVIALGARLARPGEFSERAFLNGKLDLTRAEAIADLISSQTATQARLAARTLTGVLAHRVQALLGELTALRVQVEAAIDFPDEDIDLIGNPAVGTGLSELLADLATLRAGAAQGELVRDGLLIVIAGAPNAGKSSILNALAERDAAIVTPVPGTTRDLLPVNLQIDGLPLRLIDTAGLRDSADPIEQEGIRRARDQISKADRILWIVDDADDPDAAAFATSAPPTDIPVTLVRNKIDLSGRAPAFVERTNGLSEIGCSALTGAGIAELRAHLASAAGYRGPEAGEFSARRRHLDALGRTAIHLSAAADELDQTGSAELVAESLRLAQRSLGEITGEVTNDDLLAEIFGSFCIGK